MQWAGPKSDLPKHLVVLKKRDPIWYVTFWTYIFQVWKYGYRTRKHLGCELTFDQYDFWRIRYKACVGLVFEYWCSAVIRRKEAERKEKCRAFIKRL
jgi:hypothetical protein